jgi:hypothetical protein
MQIDKQKIIGMLKDRGENDKASQADSELPETVDTDKHQGTLEKLGLDPQDLISKFGGSFL